MSDRNRHEPGGTAEPAARAIDPRAIRVASADASTASGFEAIVLEPSAIPLAQAPRVAAAGIQDDVANERAPVEAGPKEGGRVVIVDGAPHRIRLDHLDAAQAMLTVDAGGAETRTRILLLPLERASGRSAGAVRREVIVDGWRVDVEIESERQASLRERARRGRETTAHGGPTQVRAIIPGRIVSVPIVPGDPVVAGQQLLVVEAMKMQNALRAPRDGVVSSVAVAVGATIEVGDLMLVLE